MSAARLPLPLVPGTNGTYGFKRSSPADGGCGVGHYPCYHWALDLRCPSGSAVQSPVDGWVVYSVGAIPPFGGFDPMVVVIEEDNPGEKYRYHLLAHLDYYKSRGYFGDNHNGGWPTKIRKPVKAGQVVGVVGGYLHCHWQLQELPYQQNGRVWKDMTEDPQKWAQRRGATWGEPVFTVGDVVPVGLALGLAVAAAKGKF